MNAEETKQGVEAILKAGRQSATVEERVCSVTIDYRGTVVAIPIATTEHGTMVIRDAYDLAKQAHAEQHPDRAGRYAMADLESLLAWAKRHKTEDTAAFLTAPGDTPGSVQVVIDELPASGAGCHRKLSASLALKFSEALTEWLAQNDQWQSAEQFYSFIDEHTDQLTTADVLTMAKNVEIKSESSFKRSVDDSGRVKLVLEDQSGPAMSVPRKFGFVAPMFTFGDEHKLHTFTARLSLKLDKGRPMFRYQIVDLPGRVGDAMRGIRDEVGKVVGLVYMGARG